MRKVVGIVVVLVMVLLLLAVFLPVLTAPRRYTPSHPSPEHRAQREWWVGPALGLRLTPAELPRLYGSTSAEPLLKMVTGVVTGKQMVRLLMAGGWSGYRSRIYTREDYTSGGSFSETHVGNVTQTGGTHGAYEALVKNQADLILVAREPSADELKLAQDQKVPLEVHPVALDAFVFLVNRNNPVHALTLDQIRAVYSGQVTNWSQLGGPRQRIDAYQREENSGSQELMESLVMHGPLAKPGEGAYGPLVRETMRGPFYALLQDRWGLGYTVFYYEENMMYETEVAVCTVNLVAPNEQTIKSGEYPLIAPVYVAIRAGAPAASPAKRLCNWLLGEEGQMVIDASGYVSMTSAQRRREADRAKGAAQLAPQPQ
ncbi:MAG TPA: substrate-binding domain-containing protein [Armatimonadota bacterium]|jgi:phosphate transport system substrate-binding protein